jgi:hypothetical protein
MEERWAVAYGPCDAAQGEFLWLRGQGGEILIFPSRQEAASWVDAGSPSPLAKMKSSSSGCPLP